MSGEFDVAELLFEIESDVATAFGASIKLDVAVATRVPPAHCCREHLRDAVIQLLLNARDALSPGGRVSLVAEVIRRRNSAATLELQVEDNGPGMRREMLSLATEPFFTTKATGLGGLGLTIVSHFATEAGGTFRLESKHGSGTRATLSLPVRL